MPVNLASVVFNKGADYSFLAVNTLGVLYVVENGNNINSLNDLKGKTVYTTGQGATPEYIINYVLKQNDIDPQTDLTLEFVADTSEISSKLAAGTIDVAIIPEPFVTSTKFASQTNNYRVALNLTEEWNKVSETSLVQGVIVVSNKLLKENKDAVKKFLKDYTDSVNYINNNKEDAAKIVAKYGIVPNEKVALNAIPNCNIVCVYGKQGVDYMKAMLGVLFEANPKAVGGKLPTDEFYAIVND
jgi:NitT/TauT family transport system substrate-binding protein